jgi:IS4 transposase
MDCRNLIQAFGVDAPKPLSNRRKIMVAPTSCFAQALSLVNRREFERAVHLHEAEKASKGLASWDQFVAMEFCQMGSADSLREIHGGLATALGKLRHLGLKKAPARSSLSYANAHRPWQLYETVFHQVLGRCQDVAALRGRKFRFKNPLRSLDASVIDLCLEAFDWAKFRRTKGAIKLHLMLDHLGCLPCWALVTDGKTHEVKAAQTLRFEPGTIVAMDRGYNDYRLFARWCDEGVFFVTRLKDNAVYEVVERRETPPGSRILSDEVIRLTGTGAEEKCPHLLRRVVVWDKDNEREIVLMTNILHLAASTVAAIYKERWQIELFFKALKQNLKVKTFVGTSENAVKTQIWTALIAILLLKFMQLKSSFGWSLSNLAAMLRFNLLTYRDLWSWLDDPYNTPRAEPGIRQLSFIPN